MGKNNNSYFAGLTGFTALLVFYFVTMTLLAGSLEAAVDQFVKLWYFMIPLSIGFGIQVGLYWHLRKLSTSNPSSGVMMTNTATSTVGMIACCAHHLTDVLPILGLSALSVFLVKYQTPILIIGIISNALGIYHLTNANKKILKSTQKKR